MPIIQKNPNGSYWVSIPKPIVDLYGWKKGDTLEFFEERPGVMAVRKVR
jgi:bifunctional DNA-binding transcriptional regulator/antitoxin component of YhaV-PrlF toxin-antitoxin module